MLDFSQTSPLIARQLIGWTLLQGGVGGVIVETEAYDQDDPASHSFRGETPRNASMFGPPGRVYVYRSYGLHWCLNLVCGERGHGAGVLIRALEPTHGVAQMCERRGTQQTLLLASGPGRVGQALGIDRSFDGLPVDEPPFQLVKPSRRWKVVVGTRIGIARAIEQPWRFGAADSPFVSRRFR